MTIQDALTHRSCDNLRMDADKQMCGLDPDSPFVELAVEVFSMLADPTGVRIVLALQGGELPVNTIATAVDKEVFVGSGEVGGGCGVGRRRGSG